MTNDVKALLSYSAVEEYTYMNAAIQNMHPIVEESCDFFQSIVNEVNKNHERISLLAITLENLLTDEATVDRSSMEFLRLT